MWFSFKIEITTNFKTFSYNNKKTMNDKNFYFSIMINVNDDIEIYNESIKVEKKI